MRLKLAEVCTKLWKIFIDTIEGMTSTISAKVLKTIRIYDINILSVVPSTINPTISDKGV